MAAKGRSVFQSVSNTAISTCAQLLNVIEFTMKKLLLTAVALIVVLGGVLFWLASSVGPETAPDDLRTIELETNG
jgi:hypothetical protein